MKRYTYLDFLKKLAGRGKVYGRLLEHLHWIDFYWFVPNDDNREVDGKQLRELYLDEFNAWAKGQQGNLKVKNHGIEAEGGPTGSFSVPDGPCTVLEMLIALAHRLEFDLSGGKYERSVSECFWLLIDNLGLEWCKNAAFDHETAAVIDEKVRVLLGRTYDTDGAGGLFPLNNPEKDQRKVEIWYQMSAWAIENYPIEFGEYFEFKRS